MFGLVASGLVCELLVFGGYRFTSILVNSVVLAVFYYMILRLRWLSCLLILLFDCDVIFWFARVGGLTVLLLICGCSVLLCFVCLLFCFVVWTILCVVRVDCWF